MQTLLHAGAANSRACQPLRRFIALLAHCSTVLHVRQAADLAATPWQWPHALRTCVNTYLHGNPTELPT